MTKTKLDNALISVTKPVALASSIVKGEGFRITVLTSRLFRVETSPTNRFIDEATQIVWFRDTVTPNYSVIDDGQFLKIKTDDVTLNFDKQHKKAVFVQFSDGRIAKCNNKGNFKGTQRTLDMNTGHAHFLDGLMSKTGVSVVCDDSLILNKDGEIEARSYDTKDKYVFAYDTEYRQCLKDFYRITGGVPLIPRFAFGNWWSRYRAYTQEEYTTLMQRFIDEDVPLTVATIDMDWHWVDINKKFGTTYPRDRGIMPSGWTGYSWNTDLFPDYKGFLKWLNDQNLKVTMNLHPADGIRSFEDMYEPMARAMDVDPITKTDIKFDLTDNKFINAYFNVVHKPYEREGVRFWWIDWQQGTSSKLKGLDPLWALNHYHTLDNAREYRPLILSRYAGVGSHRYPLGFSGDTFMNWRSLKLQPYFTNNATNIGYTWWSHDIGGHQFGWHSDDMYLRWLQYGIFSPINRLHSTSNDLFGKEPWTYQDDTCYFAKQAMRFRHKMIPYIYTINYLTYSQGRALCEPMYYAYPKDKEAYTVPNQYFFGTELMVCPITTKRDDKTGMSSVKAWLPIGRWTDIFTGQIYKGGKYLELHRDKSSIPVLAKEGAILPLSENKGNDYSNPKQLEVWIYRGDNEFTLYEDQGEDNSYDTAFAKTKMAIKEGENLVFSIDAVEGKDTVIPKERSFKLCFKDVLSGEVSVAINDKVISKQEYAKLSNIIVDSVKSTDKVIVTIENYTIKSNQSPADAICWALSRYQRRNLLKVVPYARLKLSYKNRDYKKAVKDSSIPRKVKKIIYEKIDG